MKQNLMKLIIKQDKTITILNNAHNLIFIKFHIINLMITKSKKNYVFLKILLQIYLITVHINNLYILN